jgi:elongation factor Ts
MAVTAADVKKLRDATGAGMMDAKRALEANDADFEQAAQWLREKGIAKAAARADRDNTEGAVGTFLDREKGIAALVLLKCETDFVANKADFVNLAHDLAAAVAEAGEGAVDARKDDLDTMKITLKENIEVGDVVRIEAEPGDVLDLYAHTAEGRVTNGIIVQLRDGGTVEQAHQVGMHIAFAKPEFLTKDEIPAERIEAERATYEAIARNEGKPDAAIPKIIEGKLNGFAKEVALLEQPFVRDEKQSIRQLLGGASVVRFAQVRTGK